MESKISAELLLEFIEETRDNISERLDGVKDKESHALLGDANFNFLEAGKAINQAVENFGIGNFESAVSNIEKAKKYLRETDNLLQQIEQNQR